jgi:hypothetical protein
MAAPPGLPRVTLKRLAACGVLWLKRWNFIERARVERELWEAFERREDIEAMVAGCPADDAFRLEVWQTTLVRIRKIEQLMAGKAPTPPTDS